MSSSRLSFIVPLALAAAVVLPVASFANVYPTNLGQSANSFSAGSNITLSYLLNESATGVTVSILNSSNSVVRTITGGTNKGLNQVLWDGKDNSNVNLPVGNYSFRVSSTGGARTTWDLLTTTDDTLNNFELPQGMAVNKNPASPYYGRLYVVNPRTDSTALGRVMDDGVYMLNSDLSDTGFTGNSGGHSGGVGWLTGVDDTGGASAFRVEVGQDDNVYVTDWSDPHSGLWQAPADLSGNWTEVLDSSDRDINSGLSSVHGSISDVVVVGTGANRIIYTADEDIGAPGSIIRYSIGTDTTFTEPAGSTERSGYLFNNANSNPGGGNWNINFRNSLAVDKRGDFWYSQNRSAGTDRASLVRIAVDQQTGMGTINWDSLTSLGSPDPLRGTYGIAYDAVNDLLALATNTGGNIIIFDPNTQTVLTQFPFGATSNSDVAFDNAGNLYVGNRSDEHVRVWSPPNGGSFVANDFNTNSLAPLGAISLTAAVGLPGDFNNDSKVDASDYVTWRKNEVANASLPNDNGATTQAQRYSLWRTSFATPGAGASLDGAGVPEPTSLGLLLVAVAGSGLLSQRARRRG